MSDSVLTDSSGSYIGKIVDNGDELLLYDSSGSYVGKYVKTSDSTYDSGGSFVGKGNLITMLLKR
ncbi:MAG: hypothetical protein KA059_06375 [Elusimicrobiales bacterium]|jgi:hypothetical protein|nr:hypothetical protein [Elusimicrobiales bacterium]NLH39801.1 hypothetical protein [Elusimicrobiota bacterium]